MIRYISAKARLNIFIVSAYLVLVDKEPQPEKCL